MPSLCYSIGEVRVGSLAGCFFPHCSRPMSLGSHRSSTVAKATTRNPDSTHPFSPPLFKEGHPLSQPPQKSSPPPPTLAWEKGRASSISCLAAALVGAPLTHKRGPTARRQEWFGVLRSYSPPGTKGLSLVKGRVSLGPCD